MSEKNNVPKTKVKNPEPKGFSSDEWIIWAAWADRITFEEYLRSQVNANRGN